MTRGCRLATLDSIKEFIACDEKRGAIQQRDVALNEEHPARPLVKRLSVVLRREISMGRSSLPQANQVLSPANRVRVTYHPPGPLSGSADKVPNFPQRASFAEATKEVVAVSCAGLLLDLGEVSCHGNHGVTGSPVVVVLLPAPL